MAGMVARPGAQRRGACAAAAGAGFSTATDLADWLVRELGLPFREAHHVTGRLVGARRAPRASAWPSCRSPRCRRSSRASPTAVYEVLGVENSVASRTSYGGTAPDNVRQARAGSSGWPDRIRYGFGRPSVRAADQRSTRDDRRPASWSIAPSSVSASSSSRWAMLGTLSSSAPPDPRVTGLSAHRTPAIRRLGRGGQTRRISASARAVARVRVGLDAAVVDVVRRVPGTPG